MVWNQSKEMTLTSLIQIGFQSAIAEVQLKDKTPMYSEGLFPSNYILSNLI